MQGRWSVKELGYKSKTVKRFHNEIYIVSRDLRKNLALYFQTVFLQFQEILHILIGKEILLHFWYKKKSFWYISENTEEALDRHGIWHTLYTDTIPVYKFALKYSVNNIVLSICPFLCIPLLSKFHCTHTFIPLSSPILLKWTQSFNQTCHMSPVTCLALPNFHYMLVKTEFILKPLGASYPGSWMAQADRQTSWLRDWIGLGKTLGCRGKSGVIYI